MILLIISTLQIYMFFFKSSYFYILYTFKSAMPVSPVVQIVVYCKHLIYL